MIWLSMALADQPGLDDYVPDPGSLAPLRGRNAGSGPAWTHDLDDTVLLTSATVSWQHQPLVWTREDGEVFELLGEVVALRVAASRAVGPARVGLNMPVYLLATSDVNPQTGPVLGDADLYASASWDIGWRVGGAVHGTVPLGAATRQLGQTSPGLQGWVFAQRPGATTVQVELGMDIGGEAQIGGVRLDDRLHVVTAAHRPVGPGHLGLELAGSNSIHSLDQLPGWAAEAGPRYSWIGQDGRWVRLGASAGLTAGLGVPMFRLDLSVGLQADPDSAAVPGADGGV